MLNLTLDVLTIYYDDDQTTTDIIGDKQVPVLVTDDGNAMAESQEIINYFLTLADSEETKFPSQAVLEWQSSAFLPLQKIGYPRWSSMDLKEFSSASSKKAWRNNKETGALNFNTLLFDTPVIVQEVDKVINQASTLLGFDTDQCASLIDKAILFSILRGFFSVAEINWHPTVEQWMYSVSKKTNVKLLKEGQSYE